MLLRNSFLLTLAIIGGSFAKEEEEKTPAEESKFVNLLLNSLYK